MARSPLAVWLYGARIGILREQGYRKLRFEFLRESEERFRPGSPVFSASMPIDAQRKPNGVPVRIFFGALLPEGAARSRISAKFAVAPGDDFGLLAAIGRDCAGAVVIQPEEAPAPGTGGHLIPMTDDELAHAIRTIRDRPLGEQDGVRISLPGAQEKLVLARTEGGEWAWPADGAPSTYILKPQDMRYEAYAASEAFCLDLARSISLTTVEAEVLDLAGRPTVVVSRYDRRAEANGVTRIHQEDALQAIGKRDKKYEGDGGPSLRDFAEVLSRLGSHRDLVGLLSLTTLNVLVGNADAHAKNFSILHQVDGSIELAPAYDITPTTYYRQIPTSRGLVDLDDALGMKVNHKKSIHSITEVDLIAEGKSWGLGNRDADEVVRETVQLVSGFIDDAANRWGIPESMTKFVKNRARALSDGEQASAYESDRPPANRRGSSAFGQQHVPADLSDQSEPTDRSSESD
jgi:serine/threonine-protein kinase HipA